MTCGKKIVLVIVWVLACMYSALRLTVDKKITSYLTTAVFGFCYVEMIVCYVVIYYQVFKQRKILADLRHRKTQDQTESNSTERRFGRTIAIVLNSVLVVFTAVWSFFFLPSVNSTGRGLWYLVQHCKNSGVSCFSYQSGTPILL